LTPVQLLGPPPGPTREVLGIPVVDGKVPGRWSGAFQTEQIVADSDRVLIRQGDAALYVAHGYEVVVETRSEKERLDYDYLAYALASRVLLRQRRRFCLHATMIVSPQGQGIAITGDSMAGKSTTTMELMRRGWRFVCDDVLEVRLEGGVAVAVPFERPIHLSDASARLLGADPEIGRHLPVRDKRVFSLAGDLEPKPLVGIVRLRLGVGAVTWQPLSALEALPLIAVHSDPLGTCQHPALRSDFLAWGAGVVAHTPLCDVVRPAIGTSIIEVADAVAAWSSRLPAGGV
jgi:hypothetical protein